MGDKYKFLKIGDEIDVRNSATDEVFARVRINEVGEVAFKNLPIDRSGHEAYPSKAIQKQTFEKYYGSVSDDEPILILEFEVIKQY